MSNKIFLIGYDGSAAARRAVEFAAALADNQTQLAVSHIVEWSVYDFLGPEEVAERHKIRDIEMKTAQEKVIGPMVGEIVTRGVKAEGYVRYGHPTETLVKLAKELKASQIFVGRQGHSKLEEILFGSTANALAQMSPVPVTIVP